MSLPDAGNTKTTYSAGVYAPTGLIRPAFGAEDKRTDDTADRFEGRNAQAKKSDSTDRNTENQSGNKHKGKLPRWLISAMAWTLPVAANLATRKVAPEAWADSEKMIAGMIGGGTVASGLEYGRQKNNDGRICWKDWAINSLFGCLPFDFVLSKVGLIDVPKFSPRPPIN